MANWLIRISGKGVRQATVEKIAKALEEKYKDGATIVVTDVTPPESRVDRFANVVSALEDCYADVEVLKSELEDWLGNLPENLQDGDKAQELEAAIEALGEMADEIETAKDREVEFPAAFGS